MQTLTLEEKLEDVVQSLRTFVEESEEEYQRTKTGTRTEKDIENLADAHIHFREWAADWLNKYGKMEHPLLTTTFCWSCFDKDCDFLREFIDEYEGKCEYATAEEAAEKIKEVVFDTGQTMRKMIFGIYGFEKDGYGWRLQADEFDITNDRLIGCATVLDREWERDFGGDEDADSFDGETIYRQLQEDVEELQFWIKETRK